MIKSKISCGWTFYKTTLEEILSFGGLGICDDCGEFHPEGGFLVPVLNHWMCQKCFDEWKSRAKFYSSDLDFEQSYIKLYESHIAVTSEIGLNPLDEGKDNSLTCNRVEKEQEGSISR